MQGRARIVSTILVAVAATACMRTPTVTEVALLDGATRTLTVAVNTCNATPRAAVTETDQVVSISVRSDRPPFGSDDCADSIDIELEEPLGERRVVDGTSGDELAVIGRH